MIFKTKRLIQLAKNYLWHFPKSLFFLYKYNNPASKLTLIGITGTDGKTTTATLLHQTLLNANIKAGLITTNGAFIGHQVIDTGLHMTSPDPSLVQSIFSQMLRQGMTHAVVEVTAHALDQFRYNGCHFQVSALTNITHEHFDDFFTLSEYTQTKSKLFKLSNFSVLNSDDPSFNFLSSQVNPKQLISYSINKNSDFKANNIKSSHDLLSFDVNDLHFSTDSNYNYQIYNILAALSVISVLKIDPQVLISTIKNFPFVKGRREEVKNNLKIKTLIDFAHTPAALESTLSSLKKSTKGRLIVIFGATGGRDQSKRPLMGQVVSQNSDIAIITSDDTRHEDIAQINQQIISGIKQKNFEYYNIPDRQQAFNKALELSLPGDTIIACGKGHETSILLGDTEHPWSEAQAFQKAFKNKTQHEPTKHN